ncbi:MAG: MFS transporter [Myxococcaceae bacterium]
MPPPPGPAFTRYQKIIVAILATLQFTIILDFMILSPLGAILMPKLSMVPQQFGFVVSAYAFSAGVSGLLASGFADRFDRKRFLLFFYTGFIVGTLFCGLAPTYELLLAARIITGIFGGVVGSISFAIITDLFPPTMRGRVMGVVQTAFSASQILGIPAGLYISNAWGWHAPFLVIVAFGVVLGAVVVVVMKPVNAHLANRLERHPLQHLFDTLSNSLYLQAFATTALLSLGGFMLMPFGSAFSVRNLGLTFEQLPMIYLVTGICSMLAGPIVGRLTDAWGGMKTFFVGSALTLVLVLIYTHLGITPLPLVILVNVVLFVGVSARMISSQALISIIPEQRSRGAFMSVSSSVQQFSGGVGAATAGWIVLAPKEGPLQHFDLIGYIVSIATVITVLLMFLLTKRSRALRAVEATVAAAADTAPGHRA